MTSEEGHRGRRHFDDRRHVVPSREGCNGAEGRAVSEIEASRAVLANRCIRGHESGYLIVDLQASYPGGTGTPSVGCDQEGDAIRLAFVHSLHCVTASVSGGHSELDLVGWLPASARCRDTEREGEESRCGLDTVENLGGASESGLDEVAHDGG